MWWIWFPYSISLVLLVFVSNKLGEYVDAMDKKTKLSGAFLGGVLLAAVTSLPELITSITAAIIGQPEMTLGNILGSNVFDVAIIGFLMVLFCTRITKKTISRGNVIICSATLLVAVLILLCSIFDWSIIIPGVNINILTPIILVLYFVTLLFTREKSEKVVDAASGEEGVAKQPEVVEEIENGVVNKTVALPLKTIIIRFILLAVVLVGVSVAMTFMVDIIADMYSLQRGLAGAIFLGVATSLPEIVSTFSLVRLHNFDAGYGNIMGSCLFNFGVIAIADIFYFAGTVFITNTASMILSICLVAAVAFLLIFTLVRNSKLKIKNNIVMQIVAGILIVGCYIEFLALSV